MRERLDTVLAKKRLRELDAARQRDDMVRLEALRRSSQQAIYDYITTNQCDTVSYDAVKYLIDKELLVDIAARYCGSPFWAEAKRQYWEVLDAEHRRRNIFQKLTYILSFGRMREHSRVRSPPGPIIGRPGSAGAPCYPRRRKHHRSPGLSPYSAKHIRDRSHNGS